MTILFAISFFGLCAMLLLKALEVRMERMHVFSQLFAKGDAVIHRWIETLIIRYNWSKKVAKLFIFDFLPSYAYELVTRLKDYLANRYYHAGLQFRGRRVLRDTGSVSTFLKHIADDQGDMSQKNA